MQLLYPFGAPVGSSTDVLGVPEHPATIQQFLRWQTTRSIHDYGVMDADRYADSVEAAVERRLTATRGSHLAQRAPQVDPDECVYHTVFQDDNAMH